MMSIWFVTVRLTLHYLYCRLYRASVNGSSVDMEPVPATPDSLDPRYVFLLDAGDTLWLWNGRKSRVFRNLFRFNFAVFRCNDN